MRLTLDEQKFINQYSGTGMSMVKMLGDRFTHCEKFLKRLEIEFESNGNKDGEFQISEDEKELVENILKAKKGSF